MKARGTTVTTYYLEMLSPSELRKKPVPNGMAVCESRIPQFQVNRFLYRFVGEAWRWTDRSEWTEQAWRDLVESEDHRTWIATYQGSVAGYYELRRRPESGVEILYFGLAPPFIGHGLGGYLLTHAVESAWSWEGAHRVWVHTCSLDHPGALANYEARGFRLYRSETGPEQPSGSRVLGPGETESDGLC